MIRVGRNYGDSGTYDCAFSGFNARMSEANAILGIESLKVLDKNVARRNRMARLYKKLLGKLPGISFQEIDRADQSSFKDFSIYVDREVFGLDRDVLCEALLAENIIVKKYFYPPVHLQAAFKDYVRDQKKGLANTIKVSNNVLSLPLYSHIDKEIVIVICDAVESICRDQDAIKSKQRV